MSSADLDHVKQGQQQAWGLGELATFSKTLVVVSELLCEAVDLRAGQKILDVATGSGNTAIAAARRWCDVVGIDFVPALLEHGRRRAAVEALPVTFSEGDAEAIPFAGASFDVVLSTFGAMFAPNQEQVASELLRVCRPGGKIGMTNFPPDSFAGQFFLTNAKYLHPPRGVKPPTLWGVEERLHQLFGDGADDILMTRRPFFFRYRSAQHWLDVFRTDFGPMRAIFEALDEDNQEKLGGELIRLLKSFNVSGDATIVAPCDYIEVVIVKR